MKKKSSISIRWKTFSVFIIFAMVLIGVLWFFQIAYLNNFYKLIKTKETERVVDEVEQLLLTGCDCTDEIDELAASHNIGIFIADRDDNHLYTAEYIPNSRISTMPKYMFDLFYDSAMANGGNTVIEYKGAEMQKGEKDSYLFRAIMEREMGEDYEKDHPEESEDSEDDEADDNENVDGVSEPTPEENIQGDGVVPYTIPFEQRIIEQQEQFRQNIGNDLAESVIYVRVLENAGTEQVIMVNSVLTPIDATVSTLKAQLWIISFIMVVVAFILAVLNSSNISKSIIALNEGAKRLAGGDYSVKFDSSDYMEVAELSATLNFAATELGKTDKLQKELIANVSHDLRTPLTMIKGYAEVMRDIPGENTPENVQVIIEETERLSGLVNDVLDISKLKAGTLAIEPAEYNITESIRNVLQRYNKLREVEGYTIDFIYDDEVTVYADEKKMYQVLYNLVNNAINYTGEDKKVTVIQQVHDDILRIEVKDTGEGVKQEDIPYVWDRYYKDKTTHKRAIQGTGLGLSIVKNVLELHGAKYGVSSIQGQGATFWFELNINLY